MMTGSAQSFNQQTSQSNFQQLMINQQAISKMLNHQAIHAKKLSGIQSGRSSSRGRRNSNGRNSIYTDQSNMVQGSQLKSISTIDKHQSTHNNRGSPSSRKNSHSYTINTATPQTKGLGQYQQASSLDKDYFNTGTNISLSKQ